MLVFQDFTNKSASEINAADCLKHYVKYVLKETEEPQNKIIIKDVKSLIENNENSSVKQPLKKNPCLNSKVNDEALKISKPLSDNKSKIFDKSVGKKVLLNKNMHKNIASDKTSKKVVLKTNSVNKSVKICDKNTKKKNNSSKNIRKTVSCDKNSNKIKLGISKEKQTKSTSINKSIKQVSNSNKSISSKKKTTSDNKKNNCVEIEKDKKTQDLKVKSNKKIQSQKKDDDLKGVKKLIKFKKGNEKEKMFNLLAKSFQPVVLIERLNIKL